MGSEKPEGNWGKAKDILTIGIIPLAVWIGTQEIRWAKMENVLERQEQIRSDLHDLEIKVAAMQGPLQANTTDVASIEARLEVLTEMVKQIDENIKGMEP